MSDVVLGIAIWLGTSALFGIGYGFAWWRHEQMKLRHQRRLDLAHAARELATSDVRYRAMGGGSW